jgi:hypothetical protein
MWRSGAAGQRGAESHDTPNTHFPKIPRPSPNCFATLKRWQEELPLCLLKQ